MSRVVLVDTSVWIEHLKGKTEDLSKLGQDEDTELVTHPMVIAELALGGLASDSEVMENLSMLRQIRTVSDSELMEFIDMRDIRGKGIGYVDANLLASCVLERVELLTFDRKLNNLTKLI